MDDYYCIFDMDGTLFFTDELNNESYNIALIENGLASIESSYKRITREVVKFCHPKISEQVLLEVIRQKQEYFVKNIGKIQTNIFLFDILRKLEKHKCALWTSAEKSRAEGIINEFNLESFFCTIIFSRKKNIPEDIKYICSELVCTKGQLLVFENDASVVKELKENNVSCFLLIRP